MVPLKKRDPDSYIIEVGVPRRVQECYHRSDERHRKARAPAFTVRPPRAIPGLLVEFTAPQLRPILPKCTVRDSINRSAMRVLPGLKIAAMDVSAGCGQRIGARVAAGKIEHR